PVVACSLALHLSSHVHYPTYYHHFHIPPCASTPSHRGSPHAHLRFIVFTRYSPPGPLPLALYARRRQTLLLSLVIFIYMSTIFSRKRYSTIPITNTRIFLLYYSWLVALSPYDLISLIYWSWCSFDGSMSLRTPELY